MQRISPADIDVAGHRALRFLPQALRSVAVAAGGRLARPAGRVAPLKERDDGRGGAVLRGLHGARSLHHGSAVRGARDLQRPGVSAAQRQGRAADVEDAAVARRGPRHRGEDPRGQPDASKRRLGRALHVQRDRPPGRQPRAHRDVASRSARSSARSTASACGAGRARRSAPRDCCSAGRRSFATRSGRRPPSRCGSSPARRPPTNWTRRHDDHTHRNHQRRRPHRDRAAREEECADRRDVPGNGGRHRRGERRRPGPLDPDPRAEGHLHRRQRPRGLHEEPAVRHGRAGVPVHAGARRTARSRSSLPSTARPSASARRC